MQRLKLTLLFFLLTLISFSLQAQSTADLSNSNSLLEENLTEMTDENWSFYVDEENQLYFIDFEKISVNLSNVVVRNAQGDVLLNDDVLDLPVNTIYEIDFSAYGAGDYQIELRSFTAMLRKEVSIK
ncbi:MAG: hypothetical protein AAGG75_17890 [Bacteroidota bacterium]